MKEKYKKELSCIKLFQRMYSILHSYLRTSNHTIVQEKKEWLENGLFHIYSNSVLFFVLQTKAMEVSLPK